MSIQKKLKGSQDVLTGKTHFQKLVKNFKSLKYFKQLPPNQIYKLVEQIPIESEEESEEEKNIEEIVNLENVLKK